MTRVGMMTDEEMNRDKNGEADGNVEMGLWYYY